MQPICSCGVQKGRVRMVVIHAHDLDLIDPVERLA
jgi:hypothetical protein